MTSESTTRWPLLDERVPFATTPRRPSRPRTRRLPRAAWLLTGLAFLCGGLVSAAGFSIGWRHQAQRNTAAETALAAATAHTHALEHRALELQASLASARRAETLQTAAAATATASAKALATEATASGGAAGSLSANAESLTTSASRIASELKTLETYLTTTPAAQLDPGYISSQAAYLNRQLTKLQTVGGTIGASVASFDAAIRKLTQSATTLAGR